MSFPLASSVGQQDNMPGATPAAQKKVLIVEDNELNMKLFNDLLEANGYRTLPIPATTSSYTMPDLSASDLDFFGVFSHRLPAD